jgi:hypothetical protein
VTDVRIVRAEGLATGDAGRAKALAAAEDAIRTVTRPLAVEAQLLAA